LHGPRSKRRRADARRFHIHDARVEGEEEDFCAIDNARSDRGGGGGEFVDHSDVSPASHELRRGDSDGIVEESV
jgi:hypothetical protein